MKCRGFRRIVLAGLCLISVRLYAEPDHFFSVGTNAYAKADYAAAAQAFAESARERPAAGTLENLGLAEWRQGRVGAAVLAWEQSLWLDPFNQKAHQDLRYARKSEQLESPDLAWYEVISAWLPASWWAWLAGLGLWTAVAMTLLPGILRVRRTGWQQAVAAFGIMIFLLSLPAHLGVFTRSRLGFFLEKETELRLTPTHDGQVVARMSPGESGRRQRTRGRYVLVRTSRGQGWVEREKFARVASSFTQEGV